ncbi:glycosyltransferase family 4 protein [Pseudomonas sp. PDM18]|uniref:glycosyltransferase family 4 protein n=1 Tax=unclassified Pseudomonas TaxID=196821 RepID=UPI001786D205|nr:glycosyltransferase family 4 protein [Pseudomonas sp. PDM18]MBD9678452.1 glycosyltransferase family 4 protein [Pseudomonas sp. PDM18]
MKVLHFYKTYYPETFGGVEQVIFQICEGVYAQGIESTVLSTTNGEGSSQKVGQHNAIAVKKNFELLSTPFSTSAISMLKSLSKKVDIIHYHYPWPFMDMAHVIARIDKPSVVTYHSDVVRQKTAMKIYAPLMHRFLSSVNKIVATSPNYIQSSPILRQYAEKTEVIPIGLDENTYPRPEQSILQAWKSKLPEPFFLFVGVLRYYKGLDSLLKACEKLPYPVVIVGSGPEEARLRQTALSFGISNIHFLGALPDEDKVALLHLCHAAVFPSNLRSEAFGISLLEAAMYGKPLISCEIGTGTTYINVHGETGLVIPPDSPTDLNHAMRWLMENPEAAIEMGRNARERYQKLFRAADMSEKYRLLYNNIMAKRNA